MKIFTETTHIIKALEKEREKIDTAIRALNRIAPSMERIERKGPGRATAVQGDTQKHFSAATRKRMSIAQKRRYAKAAKTA